MMGHLSAEDVIAAVDGELTGRRRAHLERCVRCQQGVDEARATIAAAVGAGDVPEPSPLFWDHLSARVREATADEPSPAAPHWGIAVWGTVAATGLVALVLLAFGLRGPSADVPIVADGGDDDVIAAEDWEDVVAVAGELSPDEILWMFQPEAGVLIEDLTADERVVFVELLEQEMEALE